jgi:hypothetical protein
MSATYVASASDNSYAPEAEKGGFLALDVLWETTSGETRSSSYSFKAKDADGREGDRYIFGDEELGSGEVLVGDKSRGMVYFDMINGPTTILFKGKAIATVTPQ